MQETAISDFLRAHQDATQQVRVPKGTTVCLPGDICHNLVIVESGNLRVFKPGADGRSVTLCHITPGESCILTAGCILNDTPFPAIAETLTDVDLREVHLSGNVVDHGARDIARNYLDRIGYVVTITHAV